MWRIDQIRSLLLLTLVMNGICVTLADEAPPSTTNQVPASTSPSVRYGSGVESSVWPVNQSPESIAYESSLIVQIDGGWEQPSYANGPNLSSILTTTPVVERAAKASLQLAPAAVRSLVQVSAFRCGGELTRIDVRLLKSKDHDWHPQDVDKMLSSLVEGVRSVLNESIHAKKTACAIEKKQVDDEWSATEEKLNEIRKAKHKYYQLSRDIPSNLRQNDYGLSHANSQLEGSKQELARMNEQMASLEPALKLLFEREQLVKLRSEKLQQMKKEGRPDAEIKESELQLAESEANLESLRSNQNRSGRGEVMEAQRLQSRIKTTQKQIETLTEVVAKLESDEYRQLADQQRVMQQSEQQLQNTLSELINRREAIDRNLRRVIPFRLTVLDGIPDEDASKAADADKKE